MIRYLDTSVLVAAFTNEVRTRAVQNWLEKQPPRGLAVSEWVITEFSAALSIKFSTGQLVAEHRGDALTMFAEMLERSLVLLPVAGSHFRSAARLADQSALGLRAGDALHVAIVSAEGALLCTLDERLSKAAASIGIRTLLL